MTPEGDDRSCPSAPLSPVVSMVGKHVLLKVVSIGCFYGVDFPGCLGLVDAILKTAL